MKANQFAKNDEGVSAVIGVILMVAITVILAAVVAAFVFGMVGQTQRKNTPMFSVVKTSGDTLSVTLKDFNGAQKITDLTFTSPAANAPAALYPSTASPVVYPSIGVPFDAKWTSGTPFNSPNHVVATAVVDGTTVIVINTNI